MPEARRIYGSRPDLAFCDSALDTLSGADVLAIVTEWKEFRSPDFDTIRTKLSQPVIFDGRNLYDPSLVARFGLTYYAIGRGSQPQ
jgi:UDPglucose 6-dehydrogenase